jgi:Fe-S-cluster containining protein
MQDLTPTKRFVYQIREGARMEVEADGRYRLTVPGLDRKIKLHPPALGPLLLLDGRRSEEEIERKMASDGTPLPPGVISGVFRDLLIAGVLEEHPTDWLPLQFIQWPEHRCQGCGACCQGHWIGPLDPDFVERTLPRMEGLRKKYPQLADRKPFVRLDPGDSALYLNSETGQCVFLGEDLRCILHGEFGATEKPTICQMFPHVRFEDTHNTRFGVGLMCLTHFDQILESDDVAQPDHWREEHAKLDGHLFHFYPSDRQVALEEHILAGLGDASDPLGHVLAELATKSGKLGRIDAARRLEHLSRKHLRRMEECLADDGVIPNPETVPGLFPKTLQLIRDLASEKSTGRRGRLLLPKPAPALTRSRSAMLNDALTRFLFLRQYLMFMDLKHAVASYSLGIWVALSLSPAEQKGDRRMGQILATWMRAVQAPTVRRKLFGGPDEVDEYLAVFTRFWKS